MTQDGVWDVGALSPPIRGPSFVRSAGGKTANALFQHKYHSIFRDVVHRTEFRALTVQGFFIVGYKSGLQPERLRMQRVPNSVHCASPGPL